MLDPLIRKERARILEIARRHGAVNVRVFGSMARDAAGPDSDVDLLVESGTPRPPFFPGGLQLELQEMLGRKVDVLTLGALHPSIRDRVLSEARPL